MKTIKTINLWICALMHRVIGLLTVTAVIVLVSCADRNPLSMQDEPIPATKTVSDENTLYVDQNENPEGDGSSWSSAFADLQDALNAAEADLSIATIKIASGTHYPSKRADALDARSATYEIDRDDLTIEGGYGGETVLSGDLDRDGTPPHNAYHVMTIDDQANITLKRMTVRDGYGDGPASEGKNRGAGLVVLDVDNLLLDGMTFRNNETIGGNVNEGGAAVKIVSDTDVVVENSTFLDNKSGFNAGALDVSDFDGTSVTVRNSYFARNLATQHGGAIQSASPIVIEDSVFEENETIRGGLGGAIFLGFVIDDSFINNSIFRKNRADEGWGAIVFLSSGGTVEGSLFEKNEAVNGGGAVGILTLSEALFPGFPDYSPEKVVLINSVFKTNSALSGGAIFNLPLTPGSTMDIIDCDFIGNEATSGGGAIANDSMVLTITNTKLRNNTATQAGGAISTGSLIRTFGNLAGIPFLFGGDVGKVIIKDSQIKENVSSTNGGALGMGASEFTGIPALGIPPLPHLVVGAYEIEGTKIKNNSAIGLGGGIHVVHGGNTIGDLSTLTIDKSDIKNNDASAAGGLYAEAMLGTIENAQIKGNSPDDTNDLATDSPGIVIID